MYVMFNKLFRMCKQNLISSVIQNCGDGITTEQEECDDGNNLIGD